MIGAPPRLYVITDRHATRGRPLVDVIGAAVAVAPPGALAVQLREKDLSGAALTELARVLLPVIHSAGARLFINDRIDVAAAVGADGVHLGGGSLSVAQARAIAPGLAVAVSTHDVDQVRAAAHAGATFVVFGPVFDTPAKGGVSPAPVGLVGLGAACTVGVPVLALGGVDPARARSCLRAGASGLACIRAVMGAPEPDRAVVGFLAGFAV